MEIGFLSEISNYKGRGRKMITISNELEVRQASPKLYFSWLDSTSSGGIIDNKHPYNYCFCYR